MNYKKNLIYILIIFFSTISLGKSNENIAYLDLDNIEEEDAEETVMGLAEEDQKDDSIDELDLDDDQEADELDLEEQDDAFVEQIEAAIDDDFDWQDSKKDNDS